MKQSMDTKEVNPRDKKGLWKPEEDMILKKHVGTYGEGNWATVSKISGLNRGGKSCRLRWKNYLRPNIKRGAMSEEEQDLIIRMHKLLGNRWSLIAGRLPGRTDNEVKNYWNTHLSKKFHQGKRIPMELNSHCNANEDNDKTKRLQSLCDSQLLSSANAVDMTKDISNDGTVKSDISIIPEQKDWNIGNFTTESPANVAIETHTQDNGLIWFEDELFMPFYDSLPFFEVFEFNPDKFWQVDTHSVSPEFSNTTIPQE